MSIVAISARSATTSLYRVATEMAETDQIYEQGMDQSGEPSLDEGQIFGVILTSSDLSGKNVFAHIRSDGWHSSIFGVFCVIPASK